MSKKSTDLKVVSGPPAPPTTGKQPNVWKQFRVLSNLADEMVDYLDHLNEVRKELDNRMPNTPTPPPDVEEVQLLDENYDDLARCRELLKEVNRDDYYEEDDEGERVLKKEVIGKRLALMIAAVPVNGPKTPDAFVEIMLAHVFDAEVSYLALESACREIEAREKFVQVTAQVLDEIKKQEALWDKRRRAIRCLDSQAETLCKAIERASVRFELYQLGRAEDEATRRQEEARLAYQKVEAAMGKIAEAKQRFRAAMVKLKEVQKEEDLERQKPKA
jgi:hypothetical protein